MPSTDAPAATSAASPLLEPPTVRAGSRGCATASPHPRLRHHHGTRRPQPPHDGRVDARPPLAVAGLARAREALDVDPVLHGHRQPVQRPDRPAPGERPVERRRVGEGALVLERHHRIGDGVRAAQQLQLPLHRRECGVLTPPQSSEHRRIVPHDGPPDEMYVHFMLLFKQYYLGCLSQASYLIGDETPGRAVVVDPQRDIAEYLADAGARGCAIERVIETHFHADFLSGHLELAAATGARIALRRRRADRVPHRPARRRRAPLARRGRRSRSGTPRATRRSRSASSSPSAPATRSRTACSPATRCSSATSAAPTCSALVGLHRRRPGRAALPRRSTTQLLTLPGRHPRVPRPRRRVGLRQEPVHRDGSRRSASNAAPTTPCAPMSEDAFVAAVTAKGSRRRRRTSPTPRRPTGRAHAVPRRDAARSLDAGRRAGRRRRGRRPRPAGLRGGPPRRRDQRGAGRAVRRDGGRGGGRGPRHRARRRARHRHRGAQPAGAHRVRPGHRVPARGRRPCGPPPRREQAHRHPAVRRGTPRRAARRRARRPARCARAAGCPARWSCRCPSWCGGSTSSTRRSRRSCTARAATAPRSPRRRCGRPGSPTCPTSSAGSARGTTAPVRWRDEGSPAGCLIGGQALDDLGEPGCVVVEELR